MPRMAAAVSMSVVMPARSGSSAPLISSASLRRDRGVRRSCEIPASTIVRSRSMPARSLVMRLKAAATVRNSRGPSSGRGSGVKPLPTRRAALASADSGPAMRDAMSHAAASERPSVSAPQPIHSGVSSGRTRSRGNAIQYSSSSMKKLTQKPSTASRDHANRVRSPSMTRTSCATRSSSGSAGSGSSVSPGAAA